MQGCRAEIQCAQSHIQAAVEMKQAPKKGCELLWQVESAAFTKTSICSPVDFDLQVLHERCQMGVGDGEAGGGRQGRWSRSAQVAN